PPATTPLPPLSLHDALPIFKAPLLARTRIVLDGRAARSWVRRLLKRSDRMNPRTIDAVALLEAAVCQDDARSETLAVGGFEQREDRKSTRLNSSHVAISYAV